VHPQGGVYLTYVGGGGCCVPGCSGGDDTGGPAFGYTVGLFGLGHPELVIVGTDADTAGGVLNDLAARIRKGANLVPGELITFDDWPHRIVPEELPNPGGILFAANRFHARPGWAYVRAGTAAQLRRRGRPVPVGGGLRRPGQAAAARHLDRITCDPRDRVTA
jgi:Domain of unknown function (DUF4262)